MAEEENGGLPCFDPVTFSIGRTVRSLMEERNLCEADLCRGMNLPQTTINRLLSGQTNDPRISTLITVAHFFKVTVEQLLSIEPLIRPHRSGNDKGQDLPILPWNFVGEWVRHVPNVRLPNSGTVEWVRTEREFLRGSFAIWTQPSVQPFFGRKSLLLVDTGCATSSGKHNLRDGCVVLTAFKETNVVLRQLMKEGDDIFLRRLFLPNEAVLLHDLRVIKGVVVETRQYWHSDGSTDE
jgi:transcriptional regulator with XRE-family HTH domain